VEVDTPTPLPPSVAWAGVSIAIFSCAH
jgi:hypothetical protein